MKDDKAQKVARKRVIDEYTKEIDGHQPQPHTSSDRYASRTYAEWIADELGY